MNPQGRQQFGSIAIDRDAREVTVDGQIVRLTNAEFTLLSILAGQPRRAFSSEELVRLITGSDWIGGTHALHVTVSRLRTKLGESGSQARRIVTVHGYGYRFEPELGPNLPVARSAGDQRDVRGAEDVSIYWLTSLNRTILWVSDEVERLIGWQPREMLERSMYDFIHPDHHAKATKMREDLDAGYPAACTGMMLTSTGDYLSVEVLSRPIIGHTGSVEAFLGELRATPDAKPLIPPAAIRVNPDA